MSQLDVSIAFSQWITCIVLLYCFFFVVYIVFCSYIYNQRARSWSSSSEEFITDSKPRSLELLQKILQR